MTDGIIDFETDPFRHGRIPRPFAACIYFGPDRFDLIWNEKTCAALAASALASLPKCTIWAHNGGKFDFHYLLPFAERGNVEIRGGRVVRMKIGNVTLRDSYPLIPIPLAAYKKTKINYDWFERGQRNKHRAEIESYLVDDCRDLMELLTGFRAVVGQKVYTVGAAAFRSMKDMGYKIENGSSRHDAQFRPYFFGGRCEAIKTGTIQGPLEYFDINSAYPFAMLHDHPKGADRADWKYLDKLPAKAGPWFARISAISRGCLPVRGDDELLSFPRDNVIREYHATGWEIAAGLETGSLTIIDVHEILAPIETRSFDRYINAHWKNRQDAKKRKDKISEIAFKFLLNSGYGKWAQNPAHFKQWLLTDFSDYAGDEWEKESDIGDVALWSKPAPVGDHSFYNVAVAASITGFVRAMIWRAICASDGVVYCDTDSIICRRANVPTGNKLGEWKNEGAIKYAIIAAKKLYLLRMMEPDGDGDLFKIASKGVRLTVADFKKLAAGAPVTWRSDAPSFHAGRAVNGDMGARFVERTVNRKDSQQKRRKLRK